MVTKNGNKMRQKITCKCKQKKECIKIKLITLLIDIIINLQWTYVLSWQYCRLQIADQIQFEERASILKPMKKILNADLCK